MSRLDRRIGRGKKDPNSLNAKDRAALREYHDRHSKGGSAEIRAKVAEIRKILGIDQKNAEPGKKEAIEKVKDPINYRRALIAAMIALVASAIGGAAVAFLDVTSPAREAMMRLKFPDLFKRLDEIANRIASISIKTDFSENKMDQLERMLVQLVSDKNLLSNLEQRMSQREAVRNERKEREKKETEERKLREDEKILEHEIDTIEERGLSEGYFLMKEIKKTDKKIKILKMAEENKKFFFLYEILAGEDPPGASKALEEQAANIFQFIGKQEYREAFHLLYRWSEKQYPDDAFRSKNKTLADLIDEVRDKMYPKRNVADAERPQPQRSEPVKTKPSPPEKKTFWAQVEYERELLEWEESRGNKDAIKTLAKKILAEALQALDGVTIPEKYVPEEGTRLDMGINERIYKIKLALKYLNDPREIEKAIDKVLDLMGRFEKSSAYSGKGIYLGSNFMEKLDDLPSYPERLQHVQRIRSGMDRIYQKHDEEREKSDREYAERTRKEYANSWTTKLQEEGLIEPHERVILDDPNVKKETFGSVVATALERQFGAPRPESLTYDKLFKSAQMLLEARRRFEQPYSLDF